MRSVYAPFSTYTKFGEHWGRNIFDLASDAHDLLMNQASGNVKVDAVVVSSMLAQSTSDQSQSAAIVASHLGYSTPAFRVESACASGGVAINVAASFIRSGAFDNVLVIGVEKMTDHSPQFMAEKLATANFTEFFPTGITFPALYAIYARYWLDNNLISKQDLFEISAKNHSYASNNTRAQFPFKITEKDYNSAPSISDPLNLLDCSPITDGAASLLLSANIKTGLKLLSINQSTGPASPDYATDLIGLRSSQLAASSSFKDASIKPNEIDYIELHDCFTIAEAMAYVDLELTKVERLQNFIGSPQFNRINPSGGLKACGHPIGATGVKQIASLSEVLSKGEIGLAHNVGGTGQTAVVSIWEKL